MAAMLRMRYDPGRLIGVRRTATAGFPSRVPLTRASRRRIARGMPAKCDSAFPRKREVPPPRQVIATIAQWVIRRRTDAADCNLFQGATS
jgi:hypothetical protein